MTTLLIATRNSHKVQEIRAILGDAFRYFSLQEFAEAPPVIEDQPTFARNATKKARELARWLQGSPTLEMRLPGANAFVLADDSGLEVDALDGAPGVHSARFAALDEPGANPSQNSADSANNAKLLRLLKDVPVDERTARFRCVLSLVRVKPKSPSVSGYLFEGVCEGRIRIGAKGDGGFGYDPLFLPAGYPQTLAELGPDVKNLISHRAQALNKLRDQLGLIGLA
jgi:XTP/dITP diphosphohydrolase